MLGQEAFNSETRSARACPDCHNPTMEVEVINAGIFLSGVFVRYSCRRCGNTSDVEFSSIEEFARSWIRAWSRSPRR